MSLSDIITTENLDSYAEACREIGIELWIQSMEGRCRNILMPSRGSYPILDQARRAFDLELKKPYKDFDFDYIKEKFSIPRTKEIWLPFTTYCPDDSSTTSAGQREHWCKILKSILDKKQSPEFKTHQLFTQEICDQRFDFIESSEDTPNRLVIIDTVISGRAACEIADGLEATGIEDYMMLLAVDQNGEKIQEFYRKRLDQLKKRGKVKLYNFNNIFTEDSHPGLTGITSITFPQITEHLSKTTGRSTPVGFWHLEVSKREDESNLPYTITNATVNVALYRRIMHMSGTSKDRFEKHSNERERRELSRLDKEFNVGSRTFARDFIRPVLQKGIIANNISDIEISSSFVATVHLNDKMADRILNELGRHYQINHD